MKILIPLLFLVSLGAADGVGRGSLRDGPTLRLDGSGNETLLEKLRRLDQEVSDARDLLNQRDRSVADLERENALLRERGKELGSRVEGLEHARLSLEHARQEVADRGKRIDGLTAQLTSSERARLIAERLTFDLSAEILALQADDAQKLLDLQSRLRAMVDHHQKIAVEQP